MKTLAKFAPPENSQRIDPKWDWNGIRIVGNSMCQGNSNQDLLISLAFEFNLKTVKRIDTYNYYAMYFGFLEKFDPDVVTRSEMMDWRYHGSFLQDFCKNNDLPVNVVGYSSIGDKALDSKKTMFQSQFEIKPFDGSAEFIHDTLIRTKRPVSIGTLILPSGHWKRIHGSDDKAKLFYRNDPFGTYPYDKPELKKLVESTTLWNVYEKAKIRRIIALEDK